MPVRTKKFRIAVEDDVEDGPEVIARDSGHDPVRDLCDGVVQKGVERVLVKPQETRERQEGTLVAPFSEYVKYDRVGIRVREFLHGRMRCALDLGEERREHLFLGVQCGLYRCDRGRAAGLELLENLFWRHDWSLGKRL